MNSPWTSSVLWRFSAGELSIEAGLSCTTSSNTSQLCKNRFSKHGVTGSLLLLQQQFSIYLGRHTYNYIVRNKRLRTIRIRWGCSRGAKILPSCARAYLYPWLSRDQIYRGPGSVNKQHTRCSAAIVHSLARHDVVGRRADVTSHSSPRWAVNNKIS